MIIRNFGIDLHLYMKRYRQREITDNKLKLKIMNAVGFVTYFTWDDMTYRTYLVEHGLSITYHTVIMWSDFPESFMVCKKKI